MIVNPSDTIKYERAHRIGRYDSSKKRPIVAMLNHFPDKQLIKHKFRGVDNQSSSSDPSPVQRAVSTRHTGAPEEAYPSHDQGQAGRSDGVPVIRQIVYQWYNVQRQQHKYFWL